MGSATITLSPRASGTISNYVSVAGNGTDGDLSDNSAFNLTTVNPAADLALTMTDAPDPLNIGNALVYTLVVTNQGPSAAAGVNITNTLSTNVTLVSVTITNGTANTATNPISFNLGTLAPGASPTVRITVNAKSS